MYNGVMRRRYFFIVSLIFLLSLLPAGGSAAQSAEGRFFPETGHWVRGEFLESYLSAEDPLTLYGLPITDEFVDPTLGVRMQYFQRARFEVNDLAGQQPRIVLSPLGKYLYDPATVQPAALNRAGAPCKPVVSQAGEFHICYSFLDYYEAHGGAAQFGPPISNLSLEGDLYVQFFQNAKFEWHPDSGSHGWVVLADVGRIHFDQSQRDPHYLLPGETNAQFGEVLSLQPEAFVDLAVAKAGDVQVLTVIVHDQNFNLVSGANVSIVVYQADGEELQANMAPTGENGVSRLSFDVGQREPGSLVPIAVKVTYQGLSASTETWFRVWW